VKVNNEILVSAAEDSGKGPRYALVGPLSVSGHFGKECHVGTRDALHSDRNVLLILGVCL
jgi:hypothetical protein